jgi:hypothetical protein
MVGNVPQLTSPLLNYSTSADKDVNGQILYIPMEFWLKLDQKNSMPQAKWIA